MMFYNSSNNDFTLIKGDCMLALSEMSGQFDMIFADPPYFLSGAGKTMKGKNVVPVYKGDWDTVRGDEAQLFHIKKGKEGRFEIWSKENLEQYGFHPEHAAYYIVIRFEPDSEKIIRIPNLKQKIGTYLAKIRPLSDFIGLK